MKDTASTAVKDAYAGLLSGVRRVLNLGGAGKDTSVVEAHAANPDQHREELVKALTATGAGDDTEVIAAAQAVLAAIDPQGVQAGKYAVHVKDSQGVQIGDSNTMHLKF